ncbi:MAG: YcjX family protein [Xanthobacteraceae bacterium]
MFEFIEQARLAARALVEFSGHLFDPTIRLGVTGLSHAGKTVFITALVHCLLRGGRFPVFEALATGRIARAHLAPQPDDAVPRFDYESHVHALVAERRWPASTRQVSELRVIVEYQSQSGYQRKLTLDIVDYPGEWLLDLPLLTKSYEAWTAESLRLSRQRPRARLAADWHAHLATLNPEEAEDEQAALTAARLFTEYLKACRDEHYAMSLLPPGRFLMPGDLASTPALTFAPLELPSEGPAPTGSLWAMMRRRYEAYKEVVVRPFFRDHFARLDRQIVLVDALAAINAGPDAVLDLEGALAAVLDCFRTGRKTFLSALLRPRIDRILLAVTKADHLHHTSHDRLEATLKRLTERAAAKAEFAGARVDVVALAAVRATREATVRRGRERLPAILGVPVAGEVVAGETFDGETEAAMFPGDLPADATELFRNDENAFRGLGTTSPQNVDFRFLRFRPPVLEATESGVPTLPHIRLDRALQFLIGDRLI